MQQTRFYLMINFNLMKNYYLPMFSWAQNTRLNQFISILKRGNFRVLQFYPLKMNLVFEIWKTLTRRKGYSIFVFFFTSSCSSIFLIRIPLYFVYLLTLLQVTCSTNSKILTGSLNYSQVSPITSPPFLFSPYLLDLFLHMFTFQ